MYGLQPQQPVRGKKGKGQTPPPVADTIPALMAPGEAVLPKDTVQALGPENVQGLIDATHKPVMPVADPRQRVGGLKPELFFANGGITPDKEDLSKQIPTGGHTAPPSNGPQPSELSRNVSNTLNALGGLSAPIQAPARLPQALKAIEPGFSMGLHVPGQLPAPQVAKAVEQASNVARLPAPAAKQTADFVVDSAGQAVRGNPTVPAVQGASRTADAGADWVAGMGSSAQSARPVTGQMPPKNMGPVPQAGLPALPGPTQAAVNAAPAAGRSMPTADVVQSAASNVGKLSAGMSAADQSGQHPAYGQTSAPSAPQAGAQPAPDARGLYFQDRASDMSERWSKGDYAGAVGSGVRTATEGLGILALGAADNILSPWADAAGRAVDGFAGGSSAQESPAAIGAGDKPAAGATTSAPAKADEPAAQADANAPGTQMVRPGIYRTGNAYSDTASGSLGLSMPSGQPSAQNIAAADALAARSQAESMQRVQAGYGLNQSAPRRAPSLPEAPSTQLDQQAKNLLAKVLTPHAGAQNGQLTANQLNAARGILEGNQERGLKGYQSQLQAASQMQQQEMQNDGAMAREQLQQTGANQRDGARLNIDRQRLRGDQMEQGARMYEVERLSGILDELGNPETPPERSKFLQEQLQLLRGGAQSQNRFTVVPGGQEWDDKAMALRTVPSRVLNNQTGQFMDQAAAAAQPGAPAAATQGPAQPKSKAEYDALPKGAQYIKNGITYTKG